MDAMAASASGGGDAGPSTAQQKVDSKILWHFGLMPTDGSASSGGVVTRVLHVDAREDRLVEITDARISRIIALDDLVSYDEEEDEDADEDMSFVDEEEAATRTRERATVSLRVRRGAPFVSEVEDIEYRLQSVLDARALRVVLARLSRGHRTAEDETAEVSADANVPGLDARTLRAGTLMRRVGRVALSNVESGQWTTCLALCVPGKLILLAKQPIAFEEPLDERPGDAGDMEKMERRFRNRRRRWPPEGARVASGDSLCGVAGGRARRFARAALERRRGGGVRPRVQRGEARARRAERRAPRARRLGGRRCVAPRLRARRRRRAISFGMTSRRRSRFLFPPRSIPRRARLWLRRNASPARCASISGTRGRSPRTRDSETRARRIRRNAFWFWTGSGEAPRWASARTSSSTFPRRSFRRRTNGGVFPVVRTVEREDANGACSSTSMSSAMPWRRTWIRAYAVADETAAGDSVWGVRVPR